MSRSNPSIAVLGCGSWGGTLAQVFIEQGYRVTVWHRDPDRVKELSSTRRHYLVPELHFHDSLAFTASLDEALKDSEIVVIAVPSHSVRDLIQRITGILETQVLVNVAKGIENDSLLTMSQVIGSVTGFPEDRIVSLYGPSHAEEVIAHKPTTLVAACPSKESASWIQKLLSSPYLRIYSNRDIRGVEIGGSLKNVIAIATGICDGIGFGDNTKAALLTRGITEMSRLGIAMGAQPETFYGLSGIGDLIATCLSRLSRNRHVGEDIGKGLPLDRILGEMNMVAEGVKTAASVHQLMHIHNVEMPISSAVYEILFNGEDPRNAVQDLMTRDLVEEKVY